MSDLFAHLVLLLVQCLLFLLSDMSVILRSHILFFLADLAIFLVQFCTLRLGQVTFLNFFMDPFVLIGKTVVHFGATGMRLAKMTMLCKRRG